MSPWIAKPCKNCGKETDMTVFCTNCQTTGCPACVGNPNINLCNTCRTTTVIVAFVRKDILKAYAEEL
ncbi:MAG TPA: hypothetical protein GX697_02730 [Firmicutes bacterium]|nr:hypothetical protein [Bacillota bacterium]